MESILFLLLSAGTALAFGGLVKLLANSENH